MKLTKVLIGIVLVAFLIISIIGFYLFLTRFENDNVNIQDNDTNFNLEIKSSQSNKLIFESYPINQLTVHLMASKQRNTFEHNEDYGEVLTYDYKKNGADLDLYLHINNEHQKNEKLRKILEGYANIALFLSLNYFENSSPVTQVEMNAAFQKFHSLNANNSLPIRLTYAK